MESWSRKSFVVPLIALALALLFSGCMPSRKAAPGSDVYKRIPKAEHESAFPSGHFHEVEKNCYYDADEVVYYCQHE